MIIKSYIYLSNLYKLLLFIFVIFVINIQFSFAQVNTEKYRDFKDEGFYHKLNFGIEISKGNEDFTDLEGIYRFEYVNPNFQSFLVLSMNYKKGNDKLITNESFVHYRFIYNTQEIFEPEAFAQYEIDEFILIKRRILGGGGVRLNLLKDKDTNSLFNMDLGIGLMYEEEHLSDAYNTITKFVRSTNYLSLQYKISDNLGVKSVTYIQPHLENFHDFRVYSESELRIKVSDIFSLYISLKYRYDNEPPETLKYQDFNLLNGIILSF